jgi:DNA-binding response OmpR family regulator
MAKSAEVYHKKSLILTANVSIGYQAASLLENHGWHTNVVHSDLQAYDSILTKGIDAVVADIDAADLGGLAVLAFCHHRYPAIATYAITQPDDEYGKKMARDAGGCQGYFYLTKGRLQIDPGRGMAAELSAPDMH